MLDKRLARLEEKTGCLTGQLLSKVPETKRALLALGFTGPVEVLNRGWTIERVVAHCTKHTGLETNLLEVHRSVC